MSYDEYVGRSETRSDTITPQMMHAMAATFGLPPPGPVLPLLWHWTLFADWVPAGLLGPDGHPKRGGFLPPVHDLPRRMWAGGQVEFVAPLHEGEAVRRTSTILTVKEKSGSTGRLVFVTVRHDIAGPAGLAISEEQDIVYRGIEGSAVKPGEAAPPVQAVAARDVLPDPVLLFRYSALTGNGHRIHYDADYVRDVEGYPGLVVHGPLQATWMAALAAGLGPVRRFSFRGRRPAFAGHTLAVEAWREGGSLRLRTRDASGAVCMTAEAGE